MQAAHPVRDMGIRNHTQAADRAQTFRQWDKFRHSYPLGMLGVVQHCQDFLFGLVSAAKFDGTQT